MRILKRIVTVPLDFLEQAATAAGVFLYAAMIGIAFVAVILRYFFEIHILWQSQILPYVFVWGVFVGTASITRDNSHIRVTFFAEKIFGAQRAAKVWVTVENIVGIALCVYITYLSARWVHDDYVTHALIVSRPSYGQWIPHMGIMIGMGLMSIYYTERLVKQILSLRTPGADTVQEPVKND